MTKLPKIIIIGAGFGGIKMAKAFYKQPVDVLLVDRNNYHNFQPLMYQVAMGGLEPGNIAYPVRRIFRNYDNVSFRMAEVLSVDCEQHQIVTTMGVMDYDYLVIASGSENNFFNFESVKDQLLTLKSIPDAIQMRNRIFQNLEYALAKNKENCFEALLNVAIVGGGAAGVELAGALADMKKYVIPKEFPELGFYEMGIHLYQSGPTLLANMSEEASQKTLEYLEGMGVKVILNTRVMSYEDQRIVMSDGSKFSTRTVIWCAGVKGSPIEGLPEKAMLGGHRISVDGFNKVIGTSNVFAIGDVSAHISSQNPRGLPMLAPVAQQQGAHLAKNLLRSLKNKAMQPFDYKDKGVMATVGRKKAVVDLPHWKFQGGFAWFVWMFVHIFSLVGIRDKAVTLIDWIVGYFSYDQPMGMILKSTDIHPPAENKTIKEQEQLETL